MGGDGIMAWFNNQGIPSASMNVAPEMRPYFSGTNPRYQDQIMNQPPVNYQDYDEQASADLGSMGIDQNINNAPKYNWRGDTGVDAWESEHGTLEGVDDYPGIQQPRPYQDRIMNPNLMNPNQGGITAANAAQGEGKGNFLENLMNNTFLGKMAAMRNPLNKKSGNYNPALQGQIDYLQSVGGLGPTSEGYKIRGGPLEGKNLVSGFGTNDYDQMLADKQAWFEKRMADEKGYSEGNYQKLLNEIKRRNELETAATAQGAAQSGGWSAADVASSSKAFDHMGGGGPQGGGGWSPAAGQMASGMGGGSQQAKSGSQKAGGSGRTDKGWGWAQGGRVGYKTGVRVGILSVF